MKASSLSRCVFFDGHSLFNAFQIFRECLVADSVDVADCILCFERLPRSSKTRSWFLSLKVYLLPLPRRAVAGVIIAADSTG